MVRSVCAVGYGGDDPAQSRFRPQCRLHHAATLLCGRPSARELGNALVRPMSLRSAFLIAVLPAAQEAHAHAFLVKPNPAVGSMTARPGTLSLEFSEAI